MSVSERLRILARGAPTLWIDSRPRAFAFLAALLVVGGTLIALENLPAWRLLAHATPRASADNWERVSARLAQAISTKSEIVLMVGGSTTRELTGSEAYLSQVLSQTCRRRLVFVNTSTAAQNFAETWSLLDVVPENQLALAVVGLNYHSFEETPQEIASEWDVPFLPFPPSVNLGTLLEHPAHAISLHQLGWLSSHARAFMWNPRQASPAQLAILGSGEKPYLGGLNKYRDPPMSQDQKEGIARQYIAQRLAAFDLAHERNGTLWATLTSRKRSKGLPFVYLAVPESRVLATADRMLGADFAHDLEKLRQTGATVVDWRTDQGLPEQYFYDQQHLLESGRRVMFPRLLSLLQRAVPRCGKPGTAP